MHERVHGVGGGIIWEIPVLMLSHSVIPTTHMNSRQLWDENKSCRTAVSAMLYILNHRNNNLSPNIFMPKLQRQWEGNNTPVVTTITRQTISFHKLLHPDTADTHRYADAS